MPYGEETESRSSETPLRRDVNTGDGHVSCLGAWGLGDLRGALRVYSDYGPYHEFSGLEM